MAATVVLSGTATGCSDDFRRSLHDGFPAGPVFTIDGIDIDRARVELTDRLHETYHVPADRADCMVARALGAPATRTVPVSPTSGSGSISSIVPGSRRWFSGEELNALGVACDVDFSKLWYSTD